MPRTYPTPESRFVAKVNRDGPIPPDRPDLGPCHLWTGDTNPGGYGVFKVRVDGKQRTVMAHKWAYQRDVGPIPEGLTLDHLCFTPPCVNASHTEPTTQKVNNLRGRRNPTAINARKTECPDGHPLSGANLYVAPNGYRYCRACLVRYKREWRRRKGGRRGGAV